MRDYLECSKTIESLLSEIGRQTYLGYSKTIASLVSEIATLDYLTCSKTAKLVREIGRQNYLENHSKRSESNV